MDLWTEFAARVTPTSALSLDRATLLIVGAVSVAIIVIGPVWRVARLGVTFVHELGHAVVGIVCGRKFTGFVLRQDASGHAVTRGPTRGPGRVLSTWAGYPVPAIIGAALVAAALRGWAAPVLTVALLITLMALIRVRSFLTAVVTVGVIAGLGALWWLRADDWQGWVLLVVGGTLVVGAWRHLGAVMARPSSTSDPAVLAALTRVPVLLWNVSFALVCALASWFVVVQVRAVWPG
ncbi:M50 family metallopeptidase [Ruania zhangjianzhongii]|uniref:M50 family metallopeptidase n=1 Tax=Ruania zhangjianzhongii TaxID=2603206 RepID=UPI0011C9B213|nr:M50 family metallopeptidase [Ruania zhangjianzhongii]